MQSTLRKKLLDAFTEHEGEYLSGQYLADLIGCSRTAVWKHIEDLRHEGFELEAIRRKGYRIVKAPDLVTANEIRLGLKTSIIGQEIHYHETVDSTQKIAHRLGFENVPEGTVVVADEQVGGRGRMNRPWHSAKGTGVWMSIILRPSIPLPKAPQLTLLTAVAVVQAIGDCTELEPHIKWPNDILINGKKVTGILTELQAEADQIHSVIIGIGINVNQQKSDYPPELQSIATSLAIEKGEFVNRAELIQAVFTRLEKLYALYLEKGFLPIKLLWESYAISIGKKITARTLSGNLTGKALGITDDGVLMLEDDQGTIHQIYSADIEIG
ncbi:biotin--[acetyl-CoA-carboxylase] ligase [Robertmurraya kyonggiensis]|uniref:Bifunctional ligase/repressor BirA n=1 Tax=Robertmurraya kyonggiensis TaxID=1037680 RepID=A0A4U1DC87_9BACI|nr:biotin--[acetyl-CoA-carboxylase] ligase [Robertmurraya kyonggiensis]TKC19693.1 biotin--[acetyl-CoA-carboxylase] ligase [Robertmurraya kyonggiensis]